MRAIKFRAWDEKNKQMLYTVPWLICDKETGIYTVGSLDPPNPFDIDPHAEQKYQIHGYLDGGIYAYPAILMQFTGLTDYHDKEIYDGDVVQITELYGAKQQAKVFWGPVTADYQWMNGETWLLHFTSGAEGPLYPYCKPLNYYRLEVIGNIYEHPGLLPN